MEILRADDHISVLLPGGKRALIDFTDEWILTAFPVWVSSGTAKKAYVAVERAVKTEFSILRERIYLHRLIVHGAKMPFLKNEQVDHKDRDRMNNRRSNLRICSAAQNAANVAMKAGQRFKGVHQNKGRSLTKPFSSWVSYVDAKSRGQKSRKYLGHFKTEEAAARAYDQAAKEIWGEFAFLNFDT